MEIADIGAIILPSYSNAMNTKTLLTTALVQNDHDNDCLKEALQTFEHNYHRYIQKKSHLQKPIKEFVQT